MLSAEFGVGAAPVRVEDQERVGAAEGILGADARSESVACGNQLFLVLNFGFSGRRGVMRWGNRDGGGIVPFLVKSTVRLFMEGSIAARAMPASGSKTAKEEMERIVKRNSKERW